MRVGGGDKLLFSCKLNKPPCKLCSDIIPMHRSQKEPHNMLITPMYVGSEVDHPQNTSKSDIFGPKLTYILQLLVFQEYF